MPLSLHTGACTLQGDYRAANEDAVQILPLPGWTECLVADGMGGPDVGARMTQLALVVLARELGASLSPELAPDQIKAVVRRSVVKANEELLALPIIPGRAGGCTLVLSVWPV